MLNPLRVGFGRMHVRGWTSEEAAWLIESSCATQAERMYALPPAEAQRWVQLTGVELSPRVEQRLWDHEVLVLVHRLPGFSIPVGETPVDLVPDEPVAILEETKHWIELEVVTAAGAPAANARYELVLPDGEVLSGHTDQVGRIRHYTLVHEGECELRFPDVDAG